MTDLEKLTKAQMFERLKAFEADRSVEAQVLNVVALMVGDDVTAADRSRAEVALNLARELDSPSGERPSPAQVSKELGNVLDRLEKFCRDDSREGLFT